MTDNIEKSSSPVNEPTVSPVEHTHAPAYGTIPFVNEETLIMEQTSANQNPIDNECLADILPLEQPTSSLPVSTSLEQQPASPLSASPLPASPVKKVRLFI
jgi:hypothetical protein